MALVFYISHPEICVDPDVPVPKWSLSDAGLNRLTTIVDAAWIANLDLIFASEETKAIETAQILSGACGAPVSVLPQSGEIDRSSTRYVPHELHEELANLCFANPGKSAHGWEKAVDAQSRIYNVVNSALKNVASKQKIAFVGHGGVGTLLACRLGGMKIDRRHDQNRGGSIFAFEWPQEKLLFPWLPMEGVSQTDSGMYDF